MLNALNAFLASAPVAVPDSGMTVALMTGGVLTLGLIKTILNFQGTLTSWWAKIVVGMLLFAFILLQRLVIARRR